MIPEKDVKKSPKRDRLKKMPKNDEKDAKKDTEKRRGKKDAEKKMWKKGKWKMTNLKKQMTYWLNVGFERPSVIIIIRHKNKALKTLYGFVLCREEKL